MSTARVRPPYSKSGCPKSAARCDGQPPMASRPPAAPRLQVRGAFAALCPGSLRVASAPTFSGVLDRPHHACDRGGHLLPFRLLRCELLLSSLGEPAILEFALLILTRNLPFPRHPALSI